jgi:hypothetical protein
MPPKTNQAKSTTAGSGGPPVAVSQPDQYKNHEITDDQLTLLHTGGGMSKGLSNAFWGVFGGMVGSLPATISGVWGAYIAATSTPLSGPDLIQTIICAACVAVGVVIMIVERKVINPVDDLVKSIRNRQNIVTR